MRARFCLCLLLPGTLALGAGVSLPERPSADRYAKLRSSLPFAVATAAEKPAEEKVSWAQNLYLGSVAKTAVGGSEKEWLIIKDRTQPGVLIELFGNQPKDGYELVKLEWSDDPRKTKATIKKDGEFATLEPDQAAFTSTAPPASAQPPRPGGAPGTVPLPGGNAVIRPPLGGLNRPPTTIPRPTNTLPMVQPQIRPPQTVPGVPQAQMQTQPQPAGQRIENRPRVRVINSRPKP